MNQKKSWHKPQKRITNSQLCILFDLIVSFGIERLKTNPERQKEPLAPSFGPFAHLILSLSIQHVILIMQEVNYYEE